MRRRFYIFNIVVLILLMGCNYQKKEIIEEGVRVGIYLPLKEDYELSLLHLEKGEIIPNALTDTVNLTEKYEDKQLSLEENRLIFDMYDFKDAINNKNKNHDNLGVKEYNELISQSEDEILELNTKFDEYFTTYSIENIYEINYNPVFDRDVEREILKYYHDEVYGIALDIDLEINKHRQTIETALSNLREAPEASISSEIRTNVRSFIEELNDVNPPPILKDFHENKVLNKTLKIEEEIQSMYSSNYVLTQISNIEDQSSSMLNQLDLLYEDINGRELIDQLELDWNNLNSNS